MEIDAPKPVKIGYTIYTKSKCTYCDKVKELLQNENEKLVVNCDDFLLNDRDSFIYFMSSLTDNQWKKTFPVVFYREKYIGGFTETSVFYENKSIENAFNSDDF